MSEAQQVAPGWPGVPPTWTSSAKSGVGTALTDASQVWFTLSHGIFDEVYYPRVDRACIRDLGLIVTDGKDFFSEEKRHSRSQVSYLAPGVPAYQLRNICQQGRYQIEKTIVTDSRLPTVLQYTQFQPLQGALTDYHLYVLCAPHLGNRGSGNTAWVGDYKGVAMLFAQRNDLALAVACSAGWRKRSAGFVGVSDGWQDLSRHKEMTWAYSRAENGNVALTGEVDLSASAGAFVLALGFGTDAAEAGYRARAGLLYPPDSARTDYVRGWAEWQQRLLCLEPPPTGAVPSSAVDVYRTSAAVLRTHESIDFPGAIIASLSIPWGFAKGDDDLGGYHLVWPRDLAEAAGGLLAAGAGNDARRVLDYFQITQEADGHWSQNMWLDGTPYWSGVQMDETAFPILLMALAQRENALEAGAGSRLWPMVRRAAAYLVQNGPVTQMDRWEEDPGYSPFTLAVEIAALLVAADLADANGEPGVACYLRETADAWNAAIERWIYVTGTPLAQRVGVDGYYVRLAPPDEAEAASPAYGFVPIKNRPPGQSYVAAELLVSPDALALVRFGLRAGDDPRIVNTVRVIDALLKVETPQGPAWRRYNGDGYGEHEDGSPFDGSGIGRPWPLLTGERAHYELAAGRHEAAAQLHRTLAAFANDSGLLPEQIWDAHDLPERELYFGRPSGSAMPLVWAHAEYLKLCRSLRDGRVFDMPEQTVQRYLRERVGSPYGFWRFNHKCRTLAEGKTLRVEVLAPARVRWSADGWRSAQDLPTRDCGLGVHVADLATARLTVGTSITFTFYWPQANRWEGQDFRVDIVRA